MNYKHEKSPKDMDAVSDLLLTCSSAALDQRVCVWSVSRQSVLYAISICRVPTVVAWCTGHRFVVPCFIFMLILVHFDAFLLPWTSVLYVNCKVGGYS